MKNGLQCYNNAAESCRNCLLGYDSSGVDEILLFAQKLYPPHSIWSEFRL